MNITVPLALFGWVPVVVLLFALMPPRKAVLVGLIGGWLFLPMAGYDLPMIGFNKITSIVVGVMLGVLIFDSRRLLAFRPCWFDLLALLYCLCPMATSLSNDLGAYDGLVGVVSRLVQWGLLYIIGRMYFADLAGMRELAIGIAAGAPIYSPLCLIEIRFSPQLHRIVYGYHQHVFLTTIRYGGYRPMVFMQSGIALGGWMATAALAGFWLWRSSAVRSIWSIPIAAIAVVLLGMTVIVRAGSGWAQLALGLAMLFACRWSRSKIPLACAVVVVPLYMAGRFTGALPRGPIVAVVEKLSDAERAGSLDVRMRQEEAFADHTMKRPLLGWGKWMRNFPVDLTDKGLRRGVDPFWVIAFSTEGLIGLGLMTACYLLPVGLFLLRFPASTWFAPTVMGVTLAATAIVLHMIDNLANGMANPVCVVMVGGIAGIVLPSRTARGFEVVFLDPAGTGMTTPVRRQSAYA